MLDAVLAWLFGLNPALIWFGGGLICAAVYLTGVPDSDDPWQNRNRAMVAGGLVIMWPSVLIWLGPVFAVVWAGGDGSDDTVGNPYRRGVRQLR